MDEMAGVVMSRGGSVCITQPFPRHTHVYTTPNPCTYRDVSDLPPVLRGLRHERRTAHRVQERARGEQGDGQARQELEGGLGLGKRAGRGLRRRALAPWPEDLEDGLQRSVLVWG